ncbi:MAG: ribonuclease J [Chloroflexi bacterium]|nr:ribonuclease J [Chloroflexota bacterium]MCI0779340.1 ribonuclease J [Chloroflexota bacterium]MCI0888719.1 ribonuclease J [Chloroflexota bacterium]
MSNPVRIVPLGGLGEVGKNMMAVEYGDDIVVIDAGVMFPKQDMHGVDLVLPDTTYLVERADRVRAILITHGHEDHTGALPYVLRDLHVPVYAPPLAHDLVQVKLREHSGLGRYELHEVNPGDSLTFGAITAEYFRVCHSIPDSCGIALTTPAGLIVHSGDFKIDHTPVDGRRTDLQRLAELGRQGVLLLLSDSTYAEVPGYTESEQVVGVALDRALAEAPGRVLVATFASLIARVQQVVDAAVKSGRKVAPAGRSMVNNVNMAVAKGYIKAPPGTIVSLEELAKLPPERQTIVLTGAQGEPLAVLARIANRSSRDISIQDDDTVIISASTIPGNETLVARVIDDLTRQGARVVTRRNSPGVHVQGHASQEELKLMLGLIKPKYFVPIHGEYRMLQAHAELAESVGVERDNIFVIEDGDVLEVEDAGAAVVEHVPAGHVYVDGLRLWDARSAVLRDRRKLAREGLVVVVVPFDGATGEALGDPEIVTSGFIDAEESEGLIDRATTLVAEALRAPSKPLDEGSIERHVREALRGFFQEQTGRRPMIVPLPIEM